MQPEINNPNDYYKLGIFYYKPDDHRVLVPKRFGFGWTLNFANVWSYVFLLALFGLVIGVRVFAK
jgi:uncharacterized membrane protein